MRYLIAFMINYAAKLAINDTKVGDAFARKVHLYVSALGS